MGAEVAAGVFEVCCFLPLRVLRADVGSFGVAAFMLEMVPFVSLAFAFSNTVGAALWAADLERAVQ